MQSRIAVTAQTEWSVVKGCPIVKRRSRRQSLKIVDYSLNVNSTETIYTQI